MIAEWEKTVRLKILETWRRIRSSFWFLPTLMVLGAMALAFANLAIDRSASGPGDGPPAWLAVAGAEAARSLLSTIAASMITVAGVTFSIVIVALTLASSQFGSRLLAGFIEDSSNQVALGTFISIFAYCLVVLLHLPGSPGSRQLPQTSVLTAVVLALVGVGVLIYFIHHISTSIQAGYLVVEAGRTLERSIGSTLAEAESSDPDPWPPRGFSESNATIRSPASGYLSTVDPQRLLAIASAEGLRIMVVPRAGDFVLETQALALVSPPEALDESRERAICEAMVLVEKREDAADLPLAVDRLSEIAVRGLSPGINDPYTAMAAIHRLTVGFDLLLERLPARTEHADEEGAPRVFLRQPEAEELLEIAFGPIRTYGSKDSRILESLLQSLASLVRRRRPHWDTALSTQMDLVRAVSRQSIDLEPERDRIDKLYQRTRATLDP